VSNLCSFSENLGLKSIGRAGKAVTKQLGKTLTSMSDTPDKRGLKKMVTAQNPQFVPKTMERDRKVRIQAKSDLDLDTGKSLQSFFGCLQLSLNMLQTYGLFCHSCFGNR